MLVRTFTLHVSLWVNLEPQCLADASRQQARRSWMLFAQRSASDRFGCARRLGLIGFYGSVFWFRVEGVGCGGSMSIGFLCVVNC